MGSVSALNFVLPSFPNIPSCIAISRDPLGVSHDACPTLHPPLRFIPHDPHDPNDSYDLCLKTNQSLGVYRDILECYPGHPNPLQPRGLLLHPASRIPIPGCLRNRYNSPTPTTGVPPYHEALLLLQPSRDSSASCALENGCSAVSPQNGPPLSGLGNSHYL